MTPEQYEKFKQDLKQTQQRGQRMLERMDKTLEGVRQTISQIQENQQNIDNFKKRFDDVMVKLAQNIAGSFNLNPFKKIQGKKYEHLPVQKPPKEVVKAMMQYKQILIITGAGVSAPSGIPTFRGMNGLYSKKFQWQGQEIEPEAFITKQFYDKHPQAIWKWVEEIYTMATTLKPNKIHQQIDKISKALSSRGKKVTLVTQNIDDFHIKPAKKQYEYYACHGNVKQVRCSNDHLHPYQQFRKTIIKEEQVAKCPKCQEPLRPHVLFFDQSYGPLYGGDAKDKQYPFAFVIGSSLSTGLCTKLATKAKELVEINPSPVIEVGRVYQFKGKTESVLEGLLLAMGECK